MPPDKPYQEREFEALSAMNMCFQLQGNPLVKLIVRSIWLSGDQAMHHYPNVTLMLNEEAEIRNRATTLTVKTKESC